MNDDTIRSWRCDDNGNCWSRCPAAEASASATRIECLVLCEVYGAGWPCPVSRLRLALSLAAPATTATTTGPEEPLAAPTVEDRVIDALRAGPRDARQLRATVTGKAKEIDAARDALVAAGTVSKSVSGARTIFAMASGPDGCLTEPDGDAAVPQIVAGTRNDDAGDTQSDAVEQDDEEATLAELDAEFERAREVEGTAARPRKIRVDREEPT